MANGKRVALTDYVEVDGADLSVWCRGVTYTSTDDQIDASGFNASGSDDMLAGKRANSVQLDIIMSRASGGPHDVLYPLHRDRLEFDFVWRTDVNNAVGPTNPELRGTFILPEYGEGATRGDLEVATLTLVGTSTTPPQFWET